MKNLVYTLILVVVASANANAQQQAQFVQYFENIQQVNPGYVGLKEVLNASLIHREQWVGFNGRPRTTSLTIQTPVERYENVAVGFTMMNDMLGPVQDFSFNGQFSYTLRFQGARKLTFGVNAGASVLNVNSSSLLTTVEGDQAFIQMVNNRFTPNAGFGMVYRTGNWIAGLSMPKLLENPIRLGSATTIQRRHFYLLGGKFFDLRGDWDARAMTQMQITPGAPLSWDVSATAIYKGRIFFGGLYRLDASIGAFVQYQINNDFKVGLGTEYSTQAIRGYNFGTFELMLTYDLSKNRQVKRAPRYF